MSDTGEIRGSKKDSGDGAGNKKIPAVTTDLSLFKKFNPEEYYLESDSDESSDPLPPVEKKKEVATLEDDEDNDSDDEDAIYAEFCKRYNEENQLYNFLQSNDYNTEVGKEEVGKEGKKLVIPDLLTKSAQVLLTKNEKKRVAIKPAEKKQKKWCELCSCDVCILGVMKEDIGERASQKQQQQVNITKKE